MTTKKTTANQPKVKVHQVWTVKDARGGRRTIHITGRLPDGRYTADSHNPDSYSAKNGRRDKSGNVTRITLREKTILTRFTLNG